ncbi:MAG: nickel pincer cofactor biosynthesis protein LarB [Candidatus Thermoplasmatota archaeon]|nr:nickel pincer cofactor biosynthesis protein LarB [Candidatus Thermoplasmatota archaeon]
MAELNLTTEDVLKKLAERKITIKEAKKHLAVLAIEKIKNAYLDVHRKYRTGVPEIVYGAGKEEKEIIEAVKILLRRNDYALVTRLNNPERFKSKLKEFDVDCNRRAKTLLVKKKSYKFPKVGRVGILAAGTVDVSVAEEAKVAAEVMGCEVISAYDVGIAGLHRVIEPLKEMLEKNVSAIIVVAGMEGALPSIVASLIDIPVIGVPTSVGYGVGEKGLGALTTMLQTCSPGLAVVNIDNGVGAGIFAGLIARKARG